MKNSFRTPDVVVNELEEELAYIPTVPHGTLTTEEQEKELSTSCQHIVHLIGELVSYETYLLDRLKHSETERFKQ